MIVEKLATRSSKIITFEDSHSDDDTKFRMSDLLLRAIRAISVHLDTANSNNLHIGVGMEYLILSITITDDFQILKLWLHDFICNEFSSRDDFRILVNNPGTRILSPDLPHHPCNGAFNEEMKRKFEILERNLGSEIYECDFCKRRLKDLGDIAMWPDCEHVCYCAGCARLTH